MVPNFGSLPWRRQDLRSWIDLPDVPPELLEQACDDDDRDTILKRQRLLLSYFRASTDTKEEAEKLAFALAAVIFRGFRPRKADRPRPLGRRPAVRPKYEVDFLERVARAYDRKKRKIKCQSTISTKRLYEIVLKENPNFGEKLQVGGQTLSLGTFNRLLTIGRSACNYHVTWYKDASSSLSENAKKWGDHLILCLPGRAIHKGILEFSAESQLACSAILVRADAPR